MKIFTASKLLPSDLECRRDTTEAALIGSNCRIHTLVLRAERASSRVDVVLVRAASAVVPQIAHDNRTACKSKCAADKRRRLPQRDGMMGR
jgi:hypothetical protein